MNREYVRQELKINELFFSNLANNKTLDLRQCEAVVKDDTYNLVIAGAGCGKTLTMAAKVKYLIEKKKVPPEKILLLSFTKKAAEEMSNRLQNEMQTPNISATTFHALGYSILKSVNRKSFSDVVDLKEFLNQFFSDSVISDEILLEEILRFVSLYMSYNTSEFYTSGKDKVEDRQHLQMNLKVDYGLSYLEREINKIQKQIAFSSPDMQKKMYIKIKEMNQEKKTLRGERVKSLQELKIANFLFLHNIRYEYEKPHPKDPQGNNRKVYRPDFYLVDYDIYWEHFGVNREGKVPWLDKAGEQEYLTGIQWKRKFHAESGTKLIESYSYMFENDNFEVEFTKLLNKNNIPIDKVDSKKIFDAVFSDTPSSVFRNFYTLVLSFINLMKSNGFSHKWIDHTFGNKKLDEREKHFLLIIREIYHKYEKWLSDKKAIDFNDMINRATSYVESGTWKSEYSYVIVDEYQDISFGRYRLIKAIVNTNKAKLFCVGDDWQSIYRFTGSDLSLFTNFGKYWGKHQTTYIEKAYRNPRKILDISENFILKNESQIEKHLVASGLTQAYPQSLVLLKYSENSEYYSTVYRCLKNISEESTLPKVTVYILSRNNTDFSQKIFFEQLRVSQGAGVFVDKSGTEFVLDEFPNLKISCLTTHKSKGLECDYAIIVNLRDDILGFPNQISDDKLLGLLMQEGETYPPAEERRVFYVALTRARCRTYLVYPEEQPSVFLRELTRKRVGELRCRQCGSKMRRSVKENKEILVCSNNPKCSYTFSVDNAVCEICGGHMLKWDGYHGSLWYCEHVHTCGNFKRSIMELYCDTVIKNKKTE